MIKDKINEYVVAFNPSFVAKSGAKIFLAVVTIFL
jgi:hypothetical protein